MSHPRFRLRSLMLMIGAIGLLLGWWYGYKRVNDQAAHYHSLAARAGEIERGLLKSADVRDAYARFLFKEDAKDVAQDEINVARADRALAAEAAALRRAYERCAERPWIAAPHRDSIQKIEKKGYALHSPSWKSRPATVSH